LNGAAPERAQTCPEQLRGQGRGDPGDDDPRVPDRKIVVEQLIGARRVHRRLEPDARPAVDDNAAKPRAPQAERDGSLTSKLTDAAAS
jgi:hypothetical protein